MTCSPESPWRVALYFDACLPSGVFGPVECWALFRLARSLAEDISFFLSPDFSPMMESRGSAGNPNRIFWNSRKNGLQRIVVRHGGATNASYILGFQRSN